MGRIIWQQEAQNQRKDIFRYWNKRNGNNTYSKKLNTEIKHILNLVKNTPLMGMEVEQRKAIRRVLVLTNYSIFYTFDKENIYILSFWDNRQNPDGLEFK